MVSRNRKSIRSTGKWLAAAVLFTGLAIAGEARAQGLAAGLTPGARPQPIQGGIQQLQPSGPSGSPAPKTSAPRPTRRKMTNEEIAERLKLSTCHIVMTKKTPRGTLIGRGSGWIVDADQRLIVTNHHVIDADGPPDTLVCYFPVKKDGEWVADEDHYFRSVRPCKATIIASTKQHDLALLQVDHLPDGVVALPLAARSAAAGSQVHCVGGKPNGSQIMWPYAFGRVRQFGNRTNAYGLKSRMVETQLATNKGNSGGPIVNDFCELVAVVEGGYILEARVNDVSYHVDIMQVRQFLRNTRPLVAPQSARAYFVRGQGHSAQLRYGQAISDLSEAIRIDSRYSAAYTQRGLAFLKQNNLDSALGDFSDALRLNSTDAAAYFGRGQVFARKGQHQNAVREFSNAIRFASRSDVYYHSRGRSYMLLKQPQSAYADYLKAAEIDPNFAPYHGDCGIAARRLGMFDASLKHFDAAFAKNPHHRWPNQAGLTQMAMKSYKNAFGLFLAANKLHAKQTKSGSALYLFNAGYAAEKLTVYKAALTVYTEGISLNDSNPGLNADLYHRRGIVLRKLGQNQQAAADFAMAAKLAPKFYGNGAKTAAGDGNGNGTVAGNVSQIITGTWQFDGTKINIPVVAAIAFQADGRYTAVLSFKDQNGRIQKSAETGTYWISGDKIVFKSSSPNGIGRKFSYENGNREVLWVEIAGYHVGFLRAK